MLCDVGELSVLLAGSDNIEQFLDRLVGLVARHMEANVCSVYLYDERTDDLELRATIGLNQEHVGKLRLRVGEGLVGLAMRELRPIVERRASRNPAFKLVKYLDDERFDAFLAVPIQRGVERIGVLVAQRERRLPFTRADVQALRATAAQLAGAIENVRVLMSLRAPGAPGADAADEGVPDKVQGLSAVSGIAHAPAFVLHKDPGAWMIEASAGAQPCTLEQFDEALGTTADQLEQLQEHLGEELPEMGSLIFSAHLLMLHDDGFTGLMRRRIQDEEVNPPDAVVEVARRYIALFQASKNPYIREKVHDVEDLASRLLDNLLRGGREDRGGWTGRIIIATEVFPSDILELASKRASGLVLIGGGATSHVTILARSLNIPTVIVDTRALLRVKKSDVLLIDGGSGSVYVNPDEETRARFHERAQQHAEPLALGDERPDGETRTADGERVHLYTTINLLGDIRLAQDCGAEGVGLYRTEFSFLMRSDLPSESEQLVIYERLVDSMPDKRITFRTLDVGGDKLLAYLEDEGHEENPFLGMRSIRVSLRHPAMFRQQVRAILRALRGAPDGRLMFPMISSLDEFTAARDIVMGCAAELNEELEEESPPPAIGAMIEIPSVLEVIDDLAKASDFLCIGTNDFIQYMLAVDRTNERVADYFVPHHPAVLRGIKRVVDAGARHDREVSLCGEMAHGEAYLPFLVGVGIRHMSMDPHYLLAVRRAIAKIDLPTAQAQAAELLTMGSVRDIGQALQQHGGHGHSVHASMP